jgi:hypothetical protein
VVKTRKRRPAGRGPSRPHPSGTARAQATAPPRRRSFLAQAIALVAIAALGYVLLVRARGPGEIPAEALAAGAAAGCGALEQPVVPQPSRAHLEAGETFDYPDRPAAAGPHAPAPLPPDPHVYGAPVAETAAVHSLEHAYVVVYHGGLPEETVDALEAFAREQDRVIMAPYPDLPEGVGLALVAWNTRWMCPASIGAEDAVTVAAGFVDAFRGTTVAPEAPRGLLGPLFQK